MIVLVGFLVGIYVVASRQQHRRLTLRFRWVLGGALVVAASLYSLRVIQ